jgi:hypothetical protein
VVGVSFNSTNPDSDRGRATARAGVRRREVVVIAPGEGLQRDQSWVVAEQDGNVAGSFDLGLAGAAGDALPTEAG